MVVSGMKPVSWMRFVVWSQAWLLVSVFLYVHFQEAVGTRGKDSYSEII